MHGWALLSPLVFATSLGGLHFVCNFCNSAILNVDVFLSRLRPGAA